MQFLERVIDSVQARAMVLSISTPRARPALTATLITTSILLRTAGRHALFYNFLPSRDKTVID